MKIQYSFTRLAIASIAICCAMPQAWAIRDGIVRTTDTIIVHPYLKEKKIEAWKLIGKDTDGDRCSGVRISKEWIMGSAHCFFSPDPATKMFSNEFGSATVDTQTCSNPPLEFGYTLKNNHQFNDISVCRLKDGGTFPGLANYPVLAVMPAFNENNSLKMGGMLVGGLSKLGGEKSYQVGLVDLNGVPYGLDPETVSRKVSMPYVVSGDSGGAAYWLPPNGQDPALVGIISEMGEGGLPGVPWYFTAENLSKVVAYIKRVGQPTDQVPVIHTTPSSYFVPTGSASSPGMMTAAPLVHAASPTVNTSITVTWVQPSTTPVAIDRYRVTLTQDGVVSRTVWVASGQPLATNFTGLKVSANGRVCVTPSSDSAGFATSIYAGSGPGDNGGLYPVLPGCTEVDNRAPAAVGGLSDAVVSRTSVSSTIRTSWAPTDLLAKTYRVTQTTTFRAGPKRVVTKETGITSMSTSVTKGATLCTQVTPLSALRLTGAANTTCVVSN
jgi:hypothetical protein